MDDTDAASVAQALDGASKVLPISGSEVGQRVDHTGRSSKLPRPQVWNSSPIQASPTLTAPGRAGCRARGNRSHPQGLRRPVCHPAQRRNPENYTERLPGTLAQGAAGSAGEGKIKAASRQDHAKPGPPT